MKIFAFLLALISGFFALAVGFLVLLAFEFVGSDAERYNLEGLMLVAIPVMFGFLCFKFFQLFRLPKQEITLPRNKKLVLFYTISFLIFFAITSELIYGAFSSGIPMFLSSFF